MASVSQTLENLLVVPRLSKIKGWSFVLSWGHRISGLILSLYIAFHVYTLLLLKNPEIYDAQMSIYKVFPFNLLAWLLAFPVIFHALNGGRVILYESYGVRKDRVLMGAVIGLGVVYLTGLGILMIISVPITVRELFWGPLLLISVLLTFLFSFQLAKSQAGFAWKLQRLTGSFLFLMIPAHMVFMHSHPDMAHSASMVINRMQIQMIKITDLMLALGVLYHGGYGLTSIVDDYIALKQLRFGLMVIIWMLVTIAAFYAILFVVSI
jgi:succinate dehydrogenase hydrophobic anchor subunit